MRGGSAGDVDFGDGSPADESDDDQEEGEADEEDGDEWETRSDVDERGSEVWNDRVRGGDLLDLLASMTSSQLDAIACDTKEVRVLLVKVSVLRPISSTFWCDAT